MAVEIDPVWPTPQDCWHSHQGDFFQPPKPRHLMKLTLKIRSGQPTLALQMSVLPRPLDLGVRKQVRNEGGIEHQTQSGSILRQRLGFALVCARREFCLQTGIYFSEITQS